MVLPASRGNAVPLPNQPESHRKPIEIDQRSPNRCQTKRLDTRRDR